MHRIGIFLLALACCASFSFGFSNLVIFGDSLSDVGNSEEATFGIEPGGDGTDGRFSNGSVWVEYLAPGLGVASPTYSRNGGSNYAQGGATTSPNSTFILLIVEIRNLGVQVDRYLASNTPAGDELFVMWAGANDFFDGETNVATPLNRITGYITDLANAGATEFLVPNLPPLGQTPDNRGTANEIPFDQRAADFNAQLAPALDGLSASLGVTIHQLDVATLFDAILSDPALFGFANTTDQGLNAPAGADLDTYVFWDGVHPTTASHNLLAEYARQLTTLTPGDADEDGDVDLDDFNLLASNFGSATADGYLAGDFDQDAGVDLDDFNTLAAGFGGAVESVTPLPEPATVLVFALVLIRPVRD